MPKLIPVKYGNKSYPSGIKPEIKEVPAHFDADERSIESDYSLHTEYSYGKRKMNSGSLKSLEKIKGATKSGVPQLWHDRKWAKEFANYIEKFVGDERDPKYIEIHPPFNDYCSSIQDFTHIYEVFERETLDLFPGTEIVIENRSGTRYRGGSFIISKVEEIIKLSHIIESQNLRLRLVIDFPQLFSSHNLTTGKFSKESILDIVETLKPIRENITGMHIWGKRRGKNGRLLAHMGTLDTYFDNTGMKEHFLTKVHELFDDKKSRYFVPEVNSKAEDLQEIVNDFVDFGFNFE